MELLRFPPPPDTEFPLMIDYLNVETLDTGSDWRGEPQAGEPLNVLVLYDTFEAGTLAMRVLNLLETEGEPACPCARDAIRFDILSHDRDAGQALLESNRSSMVIVTSDTLDDLPDGVRTWLSDWAECCDTALATLVVLLPPRGNDWALESGVRRFVRGLAQQAGIKFFIFGGESQSAGVSGPSEVAKRKSAGL